MIFPWSCWQSCILVLWFLNVSLATGISLALVCTWKVLGLQNSKILEAEVVTQLYFIAELQFPASLPFSLDGYELQLRVVVQQKLAPVFHSCCPGFQGFPRPASETLHEAPIIISWFILSLISPSNRFSTYVKQGKEVQCPLPPTSSSKSWGNGFWKSHRGIQLRRIFMYIYVYLVQFYKSVFEMLQIYAKYLWPESVLEA